MMVVVWSAGDLIGLTVMMLRTDLNVCHVWQVADRKGGYLHLLYDHQKDHLQIKHSKKHVSFNFIMCITVLGHPAI